MLVSQTSFHGETCGGVAKCGLFSQAKSLKKPLLLAFSHLEEVCLHKGRTIRKLMGGGEVQKKYSRKGKLNEKKFMHAN